MLKNLLTKDMIETNVSVNNWIEAIKFGGDILEKKGIIEHRYIDAMIEGVNKYGPYIVIAPGIALAHANPKSGVKEIGISLITLDKGINFGHDENDPVRIVISLAAIDHETHIKALSSLANLLNDEHFLNMVLTSNKYDIAKYIKEL